MNHSLLLLIIRGITEIIIKQNIVIVLFLILLIILLYRIYNGFKRGPIPNEEQIKTF